MLAKKTRVLNATRTRKKSAREPHKQPVQQRSRETVAVILEAATRVLEKEGLVGYNTNAVAARAGVSIGSLYQYFPHKDALTLSLIAQFEQELLQAVRSAAAATRGKIFKTALRAIVHALLQTHQARPVLYRLLELEEDRLRHHVRDQGALTELHQVIRSLLLEHRSQLSAPVNAATIQDVLTIARSLVDAALLNGTPPRAAEPRIVRALQGYLLWK